MSRQRAKEILPLKLASFGKPVTLSGAVPRTLSGQEAGRVLGWGCNNCTRLMAK